MRALCTLVTNHSFVVTVLQYSCHPDDLGKLVLHAPQIVEREMYKVHSYV